MIIWDSIQSDVFSLKHYYDKTYFSLVITKYPKIVESVIHFAVSI